MSDAQTPLGTWTVNIAGPDDVHRFDTEIEALRFANQVNRTYLADLLAHPGDEVLCLATVSDASPALPTPPLRDTGVETRLPSHERLNLLGRWFEGRGMESMARICRTAATELRTAWAPWRPIETAPVGRVHSPPLRAIVAEVLDDGTPYVGEAWFDQERRRWWAANMDGSDAPGSTVDPTHWMPLPAAPESDVPVQKTQSHREWLEEKYADNPDGSWGGHP